MALLSKSDIEKFNENGFHIIENFFDPEDIKGFERSLCEVARKHLNRHNLLDEIKDGEELSLGLRRLNEVSFESICEIADTMQSFPETKRLHGHRDIPKLVNLFTGKDENHPRYITNDAAIFSMPYEKDFIYNWHKDTFYTLPHSEYMQIWAPLVFDGTKKNGTLVVCPGSHVEGHSGQVMVDGLPNRQKFQVKEEVVNKYEAIDVEIPLGSLLLFHHGLIHKSGLNTSDAPRYSLVGVYHDTANPEFYPLKVSVAFRNKTSEEYFKDIN